VRRARTLQVCNWLPLYKTRFISMRGLTFLSWSSSSVSEDSIKQRSSHRCSRLKPKLESQRLVEPQDKPIMSELSMWTSQSRTDSSYVCLQAVDNQECYLPVGITDYQGYAIPRYQGQGLCEICWHDDVYQMGSKPERATRCFLVLVDHFSSISDHQVINYT